MNCNNNNKKKEDLYIKKKLTFGFRFFEQHLAFHIESRPRFRDNFLFIWEITWNRPDWIVQYIGVKYLVWRMLSVCVCMMRSVSWVDCFKVTTRLRLWLLDTVNVYDSGCIMKSTGTQKTYKRIQCLYLEQLEQNNHKMIKLLIVQ